MYICVCMYIYMIYTEEMYRHIHVSAQIGSVAENIVFA